MRISDIMARKQTFSFEIFPPRGNLPVSQAMDIAGQMVLDSPDWISVTFSAGGSGNSDNTTHIATHIQNETGTNALAHLTCLGSSKADVEAYVARLREGGV